MEKRRLGRSGITVTDLCFGTMTFGSRNTEAEAFAMLDRAFEAGITFYDTAEVYPVPPDVKYVHRTEEIVGRWMKTKPRHAIIIASKIAGPAHGWFVPPVRDGTSAMDRHHIRQAIQGSLKRLQTDYIDLYQTHWPDHGFGYEETLSALTELKEEGLIRIAGSSNETAWGTMKAQATAEAHGLARYETIQNNFSIVNRRFEDALGDICERERISCLPYSPLGGGVCSGKYNDGALPEGARFSAYLAGDSERQKKMGQRFVNEKSTGTVAALAEVAKAAGLGLVPMCLAWSKQHKFVASTIFGTTSLEHLEENLLAADLVLTDDVLAKIDEVTAQFPYPLG